MSQLALKPGQVPLIAHAAGGRGYSARRAHRNQKVSSLRLTRRGRLFLRFGVAFTALVVAVGVLLGGNHAMAQAESAASPEYVVVVQPGQTLWDIAKLVDPQADPRNTVLDIKKRNNLVDSNVPVGTVLKVAT